MAEALEGGVRTFADVMKQDGYVNNTPEMQQKIAQDFFNERVATQPGYVDNTPEYQQQIKQDFQSQYKVSFPTEPSQGLGNIAGDLFGGVSQFVQGLPQMPGQIAQSIGNAYQQEQKAPVLDPFEQTGVAGLGAVEALRKLANAGLGLPGAIQNSYAGQEVAAKPWQIPELPGPLNRLVQQYPLTAGIGEQALNAIPLVRGGQAGGVANLAREAATYGGLGFAGTQGNLQERAGSAALAAGLPIAGYGLSLPFRPKAKPALPSVYKGPKPELQGRVMQQSLNPPQKTFFGRVEAKPERYTVQVPQEVQQAGKVSQALQAKIDSIQGKQAIDAQKTLQSQIKALEKAYADSAPLVNAPSPKVAQAAREKLENIKTLHGKLTEQYRQQYPNKAQAKASQIKTIASKTQKQHIIELGVKYRKQGGEAVVRFNNTLKKYSKQDRDLINAGIKERFTAERTAAQKANEKKAIRREIGKEKVALSAEQKKAKAKARKEQEDALIKTELEKQNAEKATQKEKEANFKASLKAQQKEIKQNQVARLKETVKSLTSDKVSGDEKALIRRQFIEKYTQPAANPLQGRVETARLKETLKNLTNKNLSPEEKNGILKQFSEKYPGETPPKPEAVKPEKKTPSVPDILSAEQIETKAKQLLGHAQALEKGQFDTLKGQIRKFANADLSKIEGVTPDRAKAISLSYQRVIDRYTQMRAELQQKPTLVEQPLSIQAEKSKKQVEQSRAKAEQKGYAPVQSEAGIERNINHAYETGTHAIVEYVAQGGKTGRGGESLNSNYRFKRDTVISPVFENANGDKIYKVINNEGQERTRHINHADSGSRTVSVTRTEEPAQYAMKDKKVIDLETGEVIPQVQTEGVFSKILEAELEQNDKIDRFLRNYKKRNLKVYEILEPAKRVSDKKLAETLEKHPEAREELATENNGVRCKDGRIVLK